MGGSPDLVKLNATLILIESTTVRYVIVGQPRHEHRGFIMDGGFTKRMAHMTILNLMHGSKKFTILLSINYGHNFLPRITKKKKSIVVNVIKKVVTSEFLACWITFR